MKFLKDLLQPQGYQKAQVQPGDKVYVSKLLGVKSDIRGGGIGGKLMDEAIKYSKGQY